METSVRNEVDRTLEQGPPPACYVHTEVTLDEFDATGSWKGSGRIHLIWIQKAKGSKTENATLEDMVKEFGYEVKPYEGLAAQLAEPLKPMKRQVQEAFRESSGKFPYLVSCECEEFGVESISFYPSMSFVHKVYHFRNAKYTRAQGQGKHARQRFGGLDRGGALLELALKETEKGSEFDPSENGAPLAFVAFPFRELEQGWEALERGVSSLIASPVTHGLTKRLTSEWRAGPVPQYVHGVDFSKTFSALPLIVIPLERRETAYRKRVFYPVTLLGLVSLVTLQHQFFDRDPIMQLVPACVAIALMVFCRMMVFSGASSHHACYFNLYFAFAILFCGAVILYAKQFYQERISWSTIGAVGAVWVAAQLCIVVASQSIWFRGTWEAVVADAKMAAFAKPMDKEAYFGGGMSRNRIVPLAGQHALINMNSSDARCRETYNFVRKHIETKPQLDP